MFQVRYDVGGDFSAVEEPTHVFDDTAISLNVSIEVDPVVVDSYSPLVATLSPKTGNNTDKMAAISQTIFSNAFL